MKPIFLPELPPKPSADVAAKLFPGFVRTEVRTSGATIPVFHKGDGPPVLLLHGYPETHVTWHKVAPQLAERFSVYVPDLRGYGDSSRPVDGDRHINYSFRAMALDQVETMRHFGHERFLVGAHDRGARVAHRLCLDFPKSVKKVCLMDIAPTLTPVLALWGARGTVGPLWDVLASWRAKAASAVTGRSLDCGHFLQEERPEETLDELQQFFGTA